jgi:NAD(P)-dependent dehydrogenase (short-subunit alcohol dehydrogenase family)
MSAMMSAIYPSLRGKRVVITGGGSGIGAAMVEAFAGQGAEVHFLDIADNEGRVLEASLAGLTPAPRFHRCDLRDLDGVKQVLSGIANGTAVDVLINNAANDDRHQIEDVTPEYWDERMATNLRHQFFCAQAVAAGMRAMGRGVILNMGSISWRLSLPDISLYLTAKAAIEGMTRGLARDLGGDGIRVNCIVPGGVRTPRQMALWHTPDEEARMLDGQCLKFRVEPHHVASMALFLASDDSAACTNSNYCVDAGWC